MGNCLSGFSSFVWHQSLDAQISQGAECIDRTGWYAVMHTQRPAPMCFGIGRILLGLCAPCRPGLGPGPGPALNCGATGPQARRNVGNHPPLLTTTSGGLLKQPYKQDVTRRVDTPLREYVGRAHRPYGNRKRRAELRHCLQGLLRWHPACTARVWGSKRFFTFGALPPDWLSAPRCDSTGCSGVFF